MAPRAGWLRLLAAPGTRLRLGVASIVIVEVTLLLRISSLRLRRGATLRLATAEERADSAEKTAALALLMGVGTLLLEFMDARFELLDAVGCRLHALFLHDDRLRQKIWRIGLVVNRLVDESLRIGVALGSCGGAHAIEERSEQLTFFRRHDGLLGYLLL